MASPGSNQTYSAPGPVAMFNAVEFATSQKIMLMTKSQLGRYVMKMCREMESGDISAVKQYPFLRAYRVRRPTKRALISATIRKHVIARDGFACKHCGSAERLEDRKSVV